jgi:glucose-6-phosphate-specific signal transduction histidine kinase
MMRRSGFKESLTNVIKHADARHVSILLARQNRAVKAVIEDDGRGFDPAEDPGEGFGLVGMRERLALLGGGSRSSPAARRARPSLPRCPSDERSRAGR